MVKLDNLDPKAYNPTFQWGFLAPKYWGVWLAIMLALPVALLPKKLHLWLSRKVANKLADKRPRGTVLNIWVNLSLCFPDKSDQEKELILRDCLTTAGTFLLSFPLITLLGRRYLQNSVDLKGTEHLQAAKDAGHNVILLAPHTWAIDVLPMLLTANNEPVVAMVKKQKDPVGDWLMHRQRMMFGARIYERSAGIKPYLKSIKEGFIGYYLPDQDHGREHSLFVDFFATQKATLPGLGKLSRLSKAVVLPSFTSYNSATGRYEVNIFPAWTDYPTGDEAADARKMNEFIEQQLISHPEQYMWIFQLLRTRPDPEEKSPYYDDKYKKQVKHK